MKVVQARFVKSASKLAESPPANMPEYAFIGRSNVGKSSLINRLTGSPKLAKTSSTPGKTQLINFFDVDKAWNLVDLPGYGFAKVSKVLRAEFEAMIHGYLMGRENLMVTFVLIDSRHEPMKVDLEFINFLGEEGVPLALVFTKADKQGPVATQRNVDAFLAKLAEDWEELPKHFVTSAETGYGRDELMNYILEVNKLFQAPKEVKG